MWFQNTDIKLYKTIKIKDIKGYVLPHAGTKYTGEIISHTLRFKPIRKIRKIYIIYYPATDKPDIEDMYHEYYVPFMCLKLFFDVEYVGINLKQGEPELRIMKDELVVVSADFSHFLPFQKAIHLENKAAHSIMFRELSETYYNSIIDDSISFQYLYKYLPLNFQLQWIGRKRSEGLNGVGYLSFLIRDKPKPSMNKPDGLFVTVYDKDMNSRECLGEWFTYKEWNKRWENNFVKNVINQAVSTSRLTGGKNKDIPIKGYTITYLYKNRSKDFIRGFHGIKHKAFYLSDVFLENTFEDGRWINNSDNQWKVETTEFNMNETLSKLKEKSFNHKGRNKTKNKNNRYQLYAERVLHVLIS